MMSEMHEPSENESAGGNVSSAKDYPDPSYNHTSESADSDLTDGVVCDESQGCGAADPKQLAEDVTVSATSTVDGDRDDENF